MNYRLKKIILLLTLIFFSVQVLNAKYIRYKKAYGKKYVYLKDVANYYGMSLVKGNKTCELRSRFSRVVFNYQKRSGKFNGIEINYLNAPFLSKGEPMLSEVDFLYYLDPMLRKGALKKQNIKKIMIDPGHGGKDTGAIGRNHREKNIVLQISKKLRDMLRKRGYQVIMTRTGDTFPTLQQRVDLCSKHQPDLFISIHCNSAAAKSARGIESYCMTPAGSASTADTKPSYKKEKGNTFDKSNARLALEVQKHLLRNTKARDRGVRHARFFVLKNISCPGVLVETGFLSNYYDHRLLGTSAYQDKVAVGLADAISAYTEAVK